MGSSDLNISQYKKTANSIDLQILFQNQSSRVLYPKISSHELILSFFTSLGHTNLSNTKNLTTPVKSQIARLL